MKIGSFFIHVVILSNEWITMPVEGEKKREKERECIDIKNNV